MSEAGRDGDLKSPVHVESHVAVADVWFVDDIVHDGKCMICEGFFK